jgi:hypothetical protein
MPSPLCLPKTLLQSYYTHCSTPQEGDALWKTSNPPDFFPESLQNRSIALRIAPKIARFGVLRCPVFAPSLSGFRPFLSH